MCSIDFFCLRNADYVPNQTCKQPNFWLHDVFFGRTNTSLVANHVSAAPLVPVLEPSAIFWNRPPKAR